MKKTINVNIGGMMFHLDDDAFEKCKSYLDALKAKFSKTEGGSEIIEDIEIRIAEIFKEKLSNTREVVSLEDVNEMISIMGDPDSFIDDTEEPVIPQNESQPIVKRRLYRDPEKRVLGGVCSGFGAYFNIDPWIVRVLMICLVLFAGVSFLLYFIFWIAMPKAVTTADRLMMRGKKVDVNSIEESVKKEWNETKSGLKNVGNNVRSSSFLGGIGKFLRISFGVFNIFFSVLILAGFLWVMLSSSATIHINHLDLSIREAARLIFDSFGEIVIAYVSAWLLIAVPAVLAIYLGIRAILQFKHKLRYIMLGGFLLWMIGLVLSIYTGVNLAEKHKMDANLKETNTMFVADSSTIKITSIIPDSITDYNVAGYPIENVNLDVIKSVDDTLPTFEITRSSSGKDKQWAQNLVNSIHYNYTVTGNQLELPSYFMLDKRNKFRGQQVDIKLMLPVGYKIYFADGSDAVIKGIKNLQNVWDSDMPTHTFTMTSKGLNCEDCPDDIIRLDHNKDMDSNKHETVDTLGNVTIKVEHSNDDE